ncbi:MAG: hypothetical protein Q9219_004144 [cf. Caloplaca sp. 3 TL-2023]
MADSQGKLFISNVRNNSFSPPSGHVTKVSDALPSPGKRSKANLGAKPKAILDTDVLDKSAFTKTTDAAMLSSPPARPPPSPLVDNPQSTARPVTPPSPNFAVPPSRSASKSVPLTPCGRRRRRGGVPHLSRSSSSSSDPFNSPRKKKPQYRPPGKDKRALKQGAVTLADVADHEILSQTKYFKPYTTLKQFAQFVLDNNIILPTERDVRGDPKWNEKECDYAATIPVKSEEEDENDYGDTYDKDLGLAHWIAGWGDLANVGRPSTFYDDPVTDEFVATYLRRSEKSNLETMSEKKDAEDGVLEENGRVEVKEATVGGA